jgi:hypothetical protein
MLRAGEHARAAYVCGRETNAELPQGEKQELEGLLWEEFLDFPKELQLKESKSVVILYNILVLEVYTCRRLYPL